MPALLGPAIDTTLAGPADCYAYGGSLIPAPFPPSPSPADPDDDTFDPDAPRLGVRVQVMLGHAITREVYGELTTAEVASWDEDVELLAGQTASITASSSDPLWSAMGLAWTVGADGRRKYTMDPGELVVWLFVDAACVWSGRFTQPVDIGNGQVALPAQGPQAGFNDRILGRAEQLDLLGDRGSFEGSDPLAGWVIPAGVTATIVTDGVRGTKCLAVIGDGWVQSPKVTLTGSNGIGVAVIGSVFGKWNISIPQGAVVVRTFTQRTDSLTPSNELLSEESSGVRPTDAEGWTDGPVVSGARMSAQAVAHRSWVEVKSFDGVTSYYDLATIRQSIQTGFPYGTNKDLSYYVERIHRDLVQQSLGGSPTGMHTRVMSLTGIETSQRWSHASRTPVRDVLSAVLDADGGPECRVTPGWTLEIHGAGLGTDRTDIALTVHDMVNPAWTVNPGGQIDDYIVDTGRGDGATWVSATVSTPFRQDAWRTVAQVQGPTGRSLNEIESWARAHARAAARTQAVADPDVPWHVAAQLNVGDRLPVLLEDGDLGEARQMRVLRIRWNPQNLTATISLGATDA